MHIFDPRSYLPAIAKPRILATSAAALLAVGTGASAQVLISAPSTHAENFNGAVVARGLGGLGTTTAVWVDNVTQLGWYAGVDSNLTPDGNLTATNGSTSTSFGLLNLGTTGNSDRALGSKVTANIESTGFAYANIAYGVLFRNTSGQVLDITNITYAGELWRSNSTVGGLAEQWSTSYKISTAAITNVEPGGNSNSANTGTFTPMIAMDWTPPTIQAPNTALNGNDVTLNKSTRSIDPNLTLAPNEFFMFRWVDTNLDGNDGQQGIDDFSITFAALAAPVIFNLSHTVGGAPNGVLAVSSSQYWLKSGLASGFATGNDIQLSQSGTATITVPAPVTAGVLTVSNATGLYTLKTDADTTVNAINGTRPLVKSGAGQLIVNGNSTGSGELTIAAGTLTIDSTTFGTVTSTIRGTGGVSVIGNATAIIGGAPNASTNNDYAGVTTVNSGATLVAGKAAGFNAIGGNLVIESGANFRYAGNNVGNQIVDTATVTINAGTFGDPGSIDPTNPGASETVANVVVNTSGVFNSGRASSAAPFIITGTLTVNGTGLARAQRGAVISANAAVLTSGSVNLDGGSGTAGNESRLDVGAGGLTINAGTINFNTGPSPLDATSVGSILKLSGNVTSTGASNFTRMNTVVPTAVLDLNAGNRTFNVTGSLEIGTAAAPIAIINGGITKSGAGTLNLNGTQGYDSLTATGGTTNVNGTLGTAPVGNAAVSVSGPGTKLRFGTVSQKLSSLTIGAGSTVIFTSGTATGSLAGDGDGGKAPSFGGGGSAADSAVVPEPGTIGLLLVGALGMLNRRRRQA